MKKLFVIGMLAGVCGFAHATSYTNFLAATSGQLSGESAYVYNESVATIQSGQEITAASVTFNNLDFTVAGPSDINNIGTLFVDLLSTHTGSKTFTDNDDSGDYFTSSKFSSPSGTVNVATQTFHLNQPASYTFNLTSAELITLNGIISNGAFNLGLDPDCVYTYSSIAFTYTIGSIPSQTPAPDMATTALLLGASLLGLEVLRRKFVPAKA